jgi:IMP dehydrogenase
MNIGVDVIKVGIGPGAACTTRRVTGFGVPQLSAIMNCYDAIMECRGKNVSLIADGGLRNSGDIIKALWGGADACMIGYMLAGTDCTPDIDGQKVYRGMSSRNVSMRNDIAPEGINIEIKYKGKTIDKLNKFILEIKSGFAMGGASNINQLRENVYANKITPAAIKESITHDGTDI